jgi:hypothetical protein
MYRVLFVLVRQWRLHNRKQTGSFQIHPTCKK